MRGFVTLLGGHGNGLTYHLYIAENHPILDAFPFETGFYLFETDRPIEKRTGHYNGYGSTGGESNPHNFAKFVEANDEITITLQNGEKITAKGESEVNNNDNNASPNKNLAAGSAEGKELNLNTNQAEPKKDENNSVAVAKKAAAPSSTNESKQLEQIIQSIQNLEQRIAELEKTGNNPHKVQELKKEVKVLESQKQRKLDEQKQIPISVPKTSEPVNTIDNSNKSNTGYILLFIGGLLVVGVAVIIGYLMGKGKSERNKN